MKWLNDHIGKLATDLVAENLHQMYMKELNKEFYKTVKIEIINDSRTHKAFVYDKSKKFYKVLWEFIPDTCYGPRLHCCNHHNINCCFIEDDLGLTFPV